MQRLDKSHMTLSGVGICALICKLMKADVGSGQKIVLSRVKNMATSLVIVLLN